MRPAAGGGSAAARFLRGARFGTGRGTAEGATSDAAGAAAVGTDAREAAARGRGGGGISTTSSSAIASRAAKSSWSTGGATGEGSRRGSGRRKKTKKSAMPRKSPSRSLVLQNNRSGPDASSSRNSWSGVSRSPYGPCRQNSAKHPSDIESTTHQEAVHRPQQPPHHRQRQLHPSNSQSLNHAVNTTIQRGVGHVGGRGFARGRLSKLERHRRGRRNEERARSNESK